MVHSIDPAGPVFISHRSTDGIEPAVALARLLRASGLPVWLDIDDLPPGDITMRLDEALMKGLSGAVLVVTPDVGASRVIREQELPALLALSKAPDFTLAILVEVAASVDINAPDRAAPARLLDPSGKQPELAAHPGIKHYSRIDLTAADIGRQFARRRLEVLRRGRRTDPLTLDVHTRQTASAYASRADLVFRSVPPAKGKRVPEPEVWEDVGRLLQWLPDVISTVKPPELLVTGAGHLGIGFALGAGLPETTGTRIAAESSDGVFRRARQGLRLRQRLPFVGIHPRRRRLRGGTGTGVAINVDVSEFSGHATFAAWAAANSFKFSRGIVLSKNGRFDSGRGAAMATTIAASIRDEARKTGTTEVLLFLRTAWPLALLVGTALNTLTVRIFEWDNSGTAPDYVEVATVRPGVGGGAVIDVKR